jgi:hypothetical protein
LTGVSSRELDSATAIAAARRALAENGDFRYGNVQKLEAEFCALELFTPSERFSAVDISLSQIKPEGRCGPPPPGNRSFTYGGRPLYAFNWHSPEFGLPMYIKFCLAGTTGMNLLVLYSFHEDRP